MEYSWIEANEKEVEGYFTKYKLKSIRNNFMLQLKKCHVTNAPHTLREFRTTLDLLCNIRVKNFLYHP